MAGVVISGPLLDSMGKSKRWSRPRGKHGRPGSQQQAPAESAGPTPRLRHLSATQVLEQIEHARHARDGAEADLATLIDYAVDQGIRWPEIAARLGVTR